MSQAVKIVVSSVLGIALAGAAYGQTPHAAPWTMKGIPDTGQTKHYTETPGEDSFYSINPPSYKDNGDGTVTDLVTGLQWQQVDGGEKPWDASVAYCKALDLAGKNDWRLPYVQELFTILNHESGFPALASIFTKSNAQYWWAAEERVGNPEYAWATNAGGGAGAHPKKETVSSGGDKRYHARCVRGAELGKGEPHYTDNRDGTVTDNRTGLVWQKAEGMAAATWEDALTYAEGLSLAGHDDWRLPNVKELESLSTPYAVRPTIDGEFFPDTPAALFWSSTSLAGHGEKAWTLSFSFGVVSYNPKTDKLHVRAVRGGMAR
jgi:Protein of unknown function (DUF1566)